MPEVEFVFDSEKEIEYQQLFWKNKEFDRFSLFSTPIDKSRLKRKIDQFWDGEDKIMIKKIEKEWRQIEVEYFKLFKDITGRLWLFKKYNAYILAFIVLLLVLAIHLIALVMKSH